jgi:2-phosphoglycerate kinase
MFQKYPKIIFLTGASGVGKTTIVDALQAKNKDTYLLFEHFDSIGIPSTSDMIEQAGSGEKWQKITTYKWIEKIINKYQVQDTVIIEGQTRLNYIEDACQNLGVTKYSIILIDCNWEIMQSRLLNERKQAELITNNMRNWANFLRNQARRKNIPIIDTSHKTLEDVLEIIHNHILSFAS